jgi:DNA modification methylase
MLESASLKFFRNISWIKNAGYLETGFGLTVQHPHARSYYPNISHEDILVYLKGNKPSRTLEPLPHEIFDLYKDDAWRFPDHGPGQPHPAVFPMSLPRTCIVGWTARNEVVADPFTGSGTTLLACEQTGRRAIAFDVDSLYVALTILRWQAFTGKSAVPE